MKISFLFLFLLFLLAPTAAQEKCGLENQPSLLGLRLNISPEEVQGILGKELKIKIKKKGVRIFFQNFIEQKPPRSLSGIRALYLRFFDLKLYQIEIFYEERPEIKTLEDFTGALSTRLNFPYSEWQHRENKAIINCGDFTLVALKTLNPRIELTDEIARAKVEAIREEADKKD